ncbi:invasion associated locus B family protein [Frigidibacter sp. ROC022]|uniref:invasion associated locus B family protein n=1 Tax=Frigidibacter sp. ROC022 TaxID=2971796 RepID=UPI00215ABFA3|nr:invasion associated locus B family protein [Frigidibacter sp. ROC022]MCR8723941.1 invasion associated locus B family protein [Frigidibacter sp. ROC022]
MNAVRLSPLAALVLALGLPLATVAQDAPATDAPAADAPAADAPVSPADQFNPGEEVDAENAPGTDYVIATEGDWQVRCVHTQDGFDPCQLYQLLKDKDGNSVAEFSMVALPEGSEAAAGATIITPLETLLTAQLTMAVDGGKAKRYPFTWCSQVGCFSRIGFTSAEVAQLKKGAKAVVTIVPMVAPDQKVQLTVSLTGFTAGFEKMKATNEETQKRADEARKAAEDN